MIAAAEPGALVRLRRRVAPPREVLLLVEVRVHRAFGLRLQPVLKVEPELGRALRPCLLELREPLLLLGGELRLDDACARTSFGQRRRRPVVVQRAQRDLGRVHSSVFTKAADFAASFKYLWRGGVPVLGALWAQDSHMGDGGID